MMTKTRQYRTAAFVVLAWAPAVWAAAAESTAIDALVVTANRAPRPISTVGNEITLIDAAAIRASQAVVASDLLQQTPGVTSARNGGVGGATQLHIRGAEGDQTVVLLDGVKLNDPSSTGGGYNFANLLIGDAARIEVLRGPQSVLWGSQAIGGVIDIITAEPVAPLEGSLDAEAGSLGTGYLRAGLGGVADRLTWRLTASHYTTDGVSSFARSRGGKEDDGYRNTGLTGKAHLALTDQLSLEARAVYSKGRNDFDGFPAPLYAFADDQEYGDTTDLAAYGGANLSLWGGRFRNRLAYAYTATDRDSYDPRQAVTPRTFTGQGRNKRWEYQGSLDLIHGWTAVFGAEDERSSFVTSSPSSFDPNPVVSRHNADLTGVYGQIVGEAIQDVTLSVGVRRDDHDTFGDSTIGQASAAWSLNKGATVLKASWGQGLKAPTLYQLYSDYGNTVLRPEAANSWDVGVVQKLWGDRIVLQGAYFNRRTHDQIDFVTCTFGSATGVCAPSGAPRFGYYDNIVRTRAEGVELQGEAQLTQALKVSGNYTYTRARDASQGPNRGKWLARRPQDAANIEVSYLWPVRLTTALAVQYAGDSFDDAANLVRNKAYALVDIRASYPLNDSLEVYGRVQNLTDQVYETIRNYGEPGRTAAVGLRARF